MITGDDVTASTSCGAPFLLRRRVRAIASFAVVLAVVLQAPLAAAGPLDVPYKADTFARDYDAIRKGGHLSEADSDSLYWHELRMRRSKAGIPAGWTLAQILEDQRRWKARNVQRDLDQERLKPTAIKVNVKTLKLTDKGLLVEAELQNSTAYVIGSYNVAVDMRLPDGTRLIKLSFGGNKEMKPGERRPEKSELPITMFPEEIKARLRATKAADLIATATATELSLSLDE